MDRRPITGITRRRAAALMSAATAVGWCPARGETPSADGDALFADVTAYAMIGEHRTGTPADAATSAWLRRRLEALGFVVELQSFSAPLYEPGACRLELQGSQIGNKIEAFPAWPVVQTVPAGLRGTLAEAPTGGLSDRIAIVRLAYGRGASWAQPRLVEPVLRAAREAAAVVAVTEGPTGLPIAMNTALGQLAWPVPVVLVGGADADRLAQAAAAGARVTLVSTGDVTPRARATNVIARRRGDGRSLIVSTPKSGWFRCAGERGGGIAVFLALAARLATATRRDLVFVATSGHELGEIGAAQALHSATPPPDQVAAWLHLGADVAVAGLSTEGGLHGTGEMVTDRRLFVDAALEKIATRAFAGQAGYAAPRVIDAQTLPGELERIRAAGHTRLAGLVGASPLFHTRLDRADIATTPALLAPVARGVRDLAEAMLRTA